MRFDLDLGREAVRYLPTVPIVVSLLLACLVPGCIGLSPSRAYPPAQSADSLRSLAWPAPSADDRTYLGLAAGLRRFGVADVAAELLLIEVFDCYCSDCQKAAPGLNELYRLVREAGLEDEIKIIGNAVGNGEIVVSAFKDTCAVPFPLLLDPDSANRDALGVTDVPCLLVVKLSGQEPAVVLVKGGSIGSARRLLGSIRRAGGV